MASIAYVTDQQMIEFHRLNGNSEINFWRPSSSTKKFADFHEGDFLFFLAKGTERGRKREKGIVGYGIYHKSTQMKFEQMWRKYKTLNGYPSKKTLYEAIVKVSKTKKMPEILNCLELKQVVFFQSPLYLSDIGIKISNQLESYFYLDRSHTNITSRILVEAEKIGIDAWSSMYHEKDSMRFQYDAYSSVVSSALEKIHELTYTGKELQNAAKLIRMYQKNIEGTSDLISKTCLLHFHKNKPDICMPLLPNDPNLCKAMIAQALWLLHEVDQNFPDRLNTLFFISEKPLKKELQSFLEALKIQTVIMKQP